MPAVQHLSYGGVTLPLAPSWLESRWLEVIHDLRVSTFFDPWNFDANTLSLPTPSLPKPPNFQLGKLTWPVGAVRPAWFHCIINTAIKNSLLSLTSNFNTPQNLVMFDGRSGHSISAKMLIAGSPRPLNQLGNEFSDLWLLTLTDQRFYWYQARGNITTPLSWTHLYSQIATILGVIITPDTIPSAYGNPSSKWALPYGPTPTILDAVAKQVGQRVVVSLDGTVKTVNWETARSAALSYVDIINNRVISGGFLDENAIARYVPANVNTLFLDNSSGTPSTTPIVLSNTLLSLAISQYGSAVGIPNYSQVIPGDLTYNGLNLTQLEDCAKQIATDYYGWQLPDLDVVYPLVEPWVMTGWEDVVEWTLKLVEGNPALSSDVQTGNDPFATTRIVRGAWNDFWSGNFYAGTTPGINSCCPPPFGSGSGSGSGSGGECPHPVSPAEAFCIVGSRNLIVNKLDVVNIGGVLQLHQCSSTTYPLGPCSPDNPDGTIVALVTKVCPVFDTINYLDWDSNPQSKQVVIGISTEKVLTVLPIADVISCVEDEVDCCSGSGSGSGGFEFCGDCVNTCDQCPSPVGLSALWQLSFFGVPNAQLKYICDPDDGNFCRFASPDLQWDLRFDYQTGLWVLTNLNDPPQDRRLWYIDGAAWQCLDENTLTAFDPDTVDAVVTPLNNCSPVTTYNCEGSGSGASCVEVTGTGGTYSTLTECQAACGGGIPTCSTVDPETLPELLNVRLTATGGSVASCVNGRTGTAKAPAPGFPPPRVWDTTSPPASLTWTCPGGTANALHFACVDGSWVFYGFGTTFGGCPMGFTIPPYIVATGGTTTPFSVVFVVPACLFVDATGHSGDTVTITLSTP